MAPRSICLRHIFSRKPSHPDFLCTLLGSPCKGKRRIASHILLVALISVSAVFQANGQQTSVAPFAFRLDANRYLYYNGSPASTDHFVSACDQTSYNNTDLAPSFETGKTTGPNTATAYIHGFTRGSTANASQTATGSALTVYALGPTGTRVHLTWTRTGQANVSGPGPSASASSVSGASAQLPGRLTDTSNENQVFDGATTGEVSCGGNIYSFVTSISLDTNVQTSGNCVGCTADVVTTLNVSGRIVGTLAVPTNLQALQIGFAGRRIQLSWDYDDNPANPIDGFRIEHKTPLGDWMALDLNLSAGDRIANDTEIIPFGTYSYRIRAYRDNGDESDSSNEVSCFQLALYTQNCGIETGVNPCTPPTQWPSGARQNNNLIGAFLPDQNSDLSQVAAHFGYDHFNWISLVMYLPSSVNNISDWQGNVLSTPPPLLDPPLGGYDYLLDDFLPYYWNEQAGYDSDYFLTANIYQQGKELDFFDHPHNDRLGASDYIQFATTLVGVDGPVGSNSKSAPITTFVWSSNNRIEGARLANLLTSPSLATGGIFNVSLIQTKDLPLSARMILIQFGVQNVTALPKVDNDAPTTTSFILGPQAISGWYTGPVEVTLIPTDTDGPSDIASTFYNIDNGRNVSYTTPFMISSNGIHTIQFESVDQAGNIETPRPSQTFRIGLAGDLNADGIIDCLDLALVRAVFGKESGQPGFDVQADANLDGVVDIRDLAFVTQHLPAGTNCNYQQ